MGGRWRETRPGGVGQSSGVKRLRVSQTHGQSSGVKRLRVSQTQVWPPTARRLGRTRQGVSESSPGSLSDNEGGGRGQSSVRLMEKEKSGLQSLECKAGQLEAARCGQSTRRVRPPGQSSVRSIIGWRRRSQGRSHSSATGLDNLKRLWSVECEVDGEGEIRAAVNRVQGRRT